jgi:uncharacterized protein YjbI with pentapeptide repeats
MDERSENRARILRSVREWNDWRSREPLNSPDLTGTVFNNTPLNGANLECCILDDAQFLGATVDGVRFVGASLERCIFVRVDLRHAVGLDLARRPEWIAFDAWTLIRSRGSVPRVLLQRACPGGDLLDQWAASQEYCSCFISYSSSDSTFVDILVDRLTHRGVEIWRDVTHLDPGMPLISTFMKAAGEADCLLAVLSEKALASSWTSLELFSARNILPVTLDQTYLNSTHPKIRELRDRSILSFQNWTRGNILEVGIEALLRRLSRSTPGIERVTTRG